jgi:predicted nucleotidyltransferase
MAIGRLLALVREHRDEVQAAVERHRGVSFTVFGSAARGEDADASDIDLLVAVRAGESLFDLDTWGSGRRRSGTDDHEDPR